MSSQMIKQRFESRQVLKNTKGFSNRGICTHLPPYSIQHLKAKQKAYEKYKKIYPVQDKQNLYPISKTPCIGFYLMKGYKRELNNSKQSEQLRIINHAKSSDKIIGNILKKYLHRKQYAESKQNDAFPKIQHSLSVSVQHGNRTHIDLKPRKQTFTRILTEYEDTTDLLKPMAITDL